MENKDDNKSLKKGLTTLLAYFYKNCIKNMKKSQINELNFYIVEYLILNKNPSEATNFEVLNNFTIITEALDYLFKKQNGGKNENDR